MGNGRGCRKVVGEPDHREVLSADHVSIEVDSEKLPLEVMFHSLEQVLLLFRRRHQTAVLRHVRPGVEAMCGRSFTRHHLAQILFVQPGVYKVSSKIEGRPTRGSYRPRDILIEFGVAEDDVGASSKASRSVRAAHPRREGEKMCDAINLDGPGGTGIESVSSRRRMRFRQMLLAARARHCKCGTDWGKNRTAGECSCLPEAPLPDTSPLPVNGKPFLGAGDQSSTGAGKNGLSLVRGLLDSGGVTRGGDESEGLVAPKNVDALRERLRKKDVLSALERNKTVEEKEADRRRRGNLPALADTVRNTCCLEAVVEALSSSSRQALSAKEARERLRILAEVVPEWCSIIAPPDPRKGASRRDGGVDDGMVGHPIKAKEVVRVNTRIHYAEVRQMIVFMAGCGDGNRARRP